MVHAKSHSIPKSVFAFYYELIYSQIRSLKKFVSRKGEWITVSTITPKILEFHRKASDFLLLCWAEPKSTDIVVLIANLFAA